MFPATRFRVVLKSRNGSREHGIALIKFGLHETKVVIRLSGAPQGVRQPAHLHDGRCGSDRKIVAHLGNVVDGRRVARMDPLARVSGFSADIHESTAVGATVIACGVVPRSH
jgi:hypothetical protein